MSNKKFAVLAVAAFLAMFAIVAASFSSGAAESILILGVVAGMGYLAFRARRAGNKRASMCCLVGGFLAAGYIAGAMAPPPTAAELAAQAVRAKAEERAALFDPFLPCYAAQHALSDHLKNPKSASFLNSCADDSFVHFTSDARAARVDLTVFATNSYGATVRESYVVELRKSGDSNSWRPTSIEPMD